MSRSTFLTAASLIALCVGMMAVMFPAQFVASKGTLPSEAANLWMRETGILLLGVGIIAFSIRRQPDSPAMKAILIGNAFIQLGLLATEIVGYSAGVITKLSGVAPNSVLHILLAWGFVYFWTKPLSDPQKS